MPVDSERLNNLCRGSAIQSDVYFSIFDDIPSQPVDLVV